MPGYQHLLLPDSGCLTAGCCRSVAAQLVAAALQAAAAPQLKLACMLGVLA